MYFTKSEPHRSNMCCMCILGADEMSYSNTTNTTHEGNVLATFGDQKRETRRPRMFFSGTGAPSNNLAPQPSPH